ncbi:MAG TPA: hypothetical protein VNG29_02150 [Candidatus Paceibacterota bacterium]|nr:hypothetical protein [Candidatus Paceibacterota bacterium]
MRNAFVRVGPLLFCLLFLIPFACAEEPASIPKKDDRCAELFLRAQKDSYDNYFEKADKEFDKYRSCRPDDPAGDWKKVQNLYFWQRSKQKKDEVILDPVTYAEVMALIDEGVAKTEIKIHAHENGEENSYVEAGLVALRGALERANGQNGGARDSVIRLKQLSDKSGYQDTKYLYGLFLYELERKGGWRRHLLPLIGIPSGDARGGLALIRDAVRNNNGPYVDDIWFAMMGILSDKKVNSKDHAEYEAILGHTLEEVYRRLAPKYPANEMILRLAPAMPSSKAKQ